jgi:hypothetical protein
MHRRLAIAVAVTLAALAAPGAASANDAPVCVDTFYETVRNTPVPVSGGCTDRDGPAPLNYAIVNTSGPTNGFLSNQNPAGSATYNPNPNFVGTDSFRFTATDGLGATSNEATAHITVEDADGVNSPPVCPSPEHFVAVGSSTVFSGNCADPDGDTLSYFLDSGPDPAIGRLDLLPPSTVVFHALDEGTTSIGYHANDGAVNSNPAAVLLNVVPPGGGEFSTGEEASEGEPAVASITTSETGSVVVTQVAATGTAPAGLAFLPFQFNIEAPNGNPLTLRFTLDASAIPSGESAQTLVVLRDGAEILPCTGTGLGPDPCVSNRATVGDGDAELTVLSTHASAWNFAVRTVKPKAGKGCGDRNHAHAREGECKKSAK